MLIYILRRIVYMVPTLLLISVVAFIIIELPPGDYVTTYVQQLRSQQGSEISQERIRSIRERYGLNLPLHRRYLRWIWQLLHGDFGYSLVYEEPVRKLLAERLPLTVIISTSSIIFTWLLAIPIGIYSAVRQYTVGDYFWTIVGFLGLSIPNFFLALLLMFVGYKYFGVNVGGLFSKQYLDAAWSWAKFVDMLKHLWIPTIVIGTAGTASMIRVLRATMLDELGKDYVRTGRAKGLSEFWLFLKYPLRVAINPLISTAGWLLPQIVSGAVITSVVLSLPTTGPLLLSALMNQDMQLAGSFIMMLSTLTVVGTLISDVLLAWVDPRIRYD